MKKISVLFTLGVTVLLISAAVAIGNPAALEVSKTADTDEVYPGYMLTYTVVVKNTGGNTLNNLVLVDDWPHQDVTLSVSSLPDSCGYNTSDHTITCIVGQLKKGESKTYIFTGEVTADSGTIENEVEVSNEKEHSNNQNTVSVDAKEETVAIPEYPMAVLPIILSIASFGIVCRFRKRS